MAEVRCVVATGGETCREGEVAVAVDVLRASTTITVALDLGASAVRVTPDVAEARELARAHGALLMGERRNEIIPGFDLGNSPVALLAEGDRVRGRAIVFTSSNFPRAAAGCGPASLALVGCLLNLGAVCDALVARPGPDVCIVLAGNLEATADEDLAFAGACAARLAEVGFGLDGSAADAVRLVRERGIEGCVLGAPHAAALERQGFGEDVRYAARVDLTRMMGVLREGWIRAGVPSVGTMA